MLRLVVATTNTNKVREIRALLHGVDVALMTLETLPRIEPPEETGRTFEENALQKAFYYSALTDELVVAEDSGLEIDALGGVPGVESARFGGAASSYAAKFALIYAALRKGGHQDPTARFVCALALVRGREILFETRASTEGEIAPAAQGSGGFGYDPIFFYPPYARTFGEVTSEEKSAVSHRGKAFRRLREFLLTAPSAKP